MVNIPADSLSREKGLPLAVLLLLDQWEWPLLGPVAQSVIPLLGDLQIGLSVIKVKLQRLLCCSPTPGTGVLARHRLSLPWSGLLGYAFPPLTLLLRVLGKVLMDQAPLVLVTPHRSFRLWFTTLLTLLVQPSVALSPVQVLLS